MGTSKQWKNSSLNLLVLIYFMSLYSTTFCDIHPIDVEPVKKEQLDFEDDTGMGSIQSDATKNSAKDNALPGSEKKNAQDIVNKFSQSSSDTTFTHGFVASLCVIVVSELGDKTFFIAAIMAMNHARKIVFFGAMAALGTMHIGSALFGFMITMVPRLLTFYASTILFAVFGIKMIRDGYKMKPEEANEEMEEVQNDLRRRDSNFEKESLETGGSPGWKPPSRNPLKRCFSRVFLQAFTLTFLAEWGDRSQIATVILAAREDVYGVIVGGLLGHSLCTGLAVIGGRIIASRISVRTVTIIGGIVFILFAISALIMGP